MQYFLLHLYILSSSSSSFFSETLLFRSLRLLCSRSTFYHFLIYLSLILYSSLEYFFVLLDFVFLKASTTLTLFCVCFVVFNFFFFSCDCHYFVLTCVAGANKIVEVIATTIKRVANKNDNGDIWFRYQHFQLALTLMLLFLIKNIHVHPIHFFFHNNSGNIF